MLLRIYSTATTWDTNINDHFSQTVDAIKKTAGTCFTRSDAAPTQPRISTATMGLMRTRRHAQLARRCEDKK